MIVLVSTRASRFLLLASLLVFVFLSYFSIRNARAAHAIGLNTREGYEKAVRLEPNDARNWYLLGRFYQYDFEQADSNAALRAFLRARSLDPLSADILLDLATNYDETGKTPEARAAYIEAKRVYPLSAEVLWRYGNFLLRQNEADSAFAEIRRAVELDPKRSAEAFSRCRRVVPDANVILDKVIPPNLESYIDIIVDLANDNQLDLAMSVWSRANTAPGILQLRDLVPFENSLVQNNRAGDAALLWQQAASKVEKPIPPDPPGSVLWDGGFEAGFPYGGLGWQFVPEINTVQIAFDRHEKHSGEQSLRLMFTGRANLNFSAVCHWIPVEGGRSYQFSAWIQTKSLTTEQGVSFTLYTNDRGKRTALSTREIHGDQPWTNVVLPWTAPLGSQFVSVCVTRQQSEQENGDIQGTAWVDDVSLVPANPEHNSR